MDTTPTCADCDGPIEPKRLSLFLSLQSAPTGAFTCQSCGDRIYQDAQQDPSRSPGPPPIELLFDRSGLPARFHGERLADVDPLDRGDLLLSLNGWVETFAEGTGLYLMGEPGRGKTYMAAVAAAEVLRRGHAVQWVSVPELALQLASSFDDPERDHALRVVRSKTPLVLDDLGQENPTESLRQVLHNAITKRENAASSLLITSNLTPDELGARYGKWLPSRLAGFCELRRVPGRDRRLDRYRQDP